MFVLSKMQVTAIESSMEERYHKELLAYFPTHHADETAAATDGELLSTIARSVGSARRLGVASSGVLLRYVALAVLVNPDFEAPPEVRALFEAPGLDAEYKVHPFSDILIAKLGNA